MDLETAQSFFKKYSELDYQAQLHSFGSEPQETWQPHVIARRDLFSKKVRTRGHLATGGDEKRKSLVKRKLFAVAIFQSSEHGTIAAGYVGGNGETTANVLDRVLIAIEEDGKPLIVTNQSIDVEGDFAHIQSSDGLDLGELGKPVAAKVFARPENAAEAKLLPKHKGELPKLPATKACSVVRPIATGPSSGQPRRGKAGSDRDMAKRDRRVRLQLRQVVAIRKARKKGVPIARLAQHFGVGKTTVQDILEGRTWRHASDLRSLAPHPECDRRGVRLLDVLRVLLDKPITIEALARRLDAPARSIHRDLRILHFAGIRILQVADRFHLVRRSLVRALRWDGADAPFVLRAPLR